MTGEKGKRLGHVEQISKNKAEWKSAEKERVKKQCSQLLDAIRVSVRPVGHNHVDNHEIK